MSTPIITFDWEAAVGPISKAEGIQAQFLSYKEHVADERKEHFASGGRIDLKLLELWRRLEAILDDHLARLQTTSGDENLERLSKSAARKMHKMYKLHDEETKAATADA